MPPAIKQLTKQDLMASRPFTNLFTTAKINSIVGGHSLAKNSVAVFSRIRLCGGPNISFGAKGSSEIPILRWESASHPVMEVNWTVSAAPDNVIYEERR